jgi:cytochrome bd ubiquinol oxidase subunit II
MSLADVPAILILVGLAAYAVLAGADFGAGFWQLLGGRSERDRELREHAHHAMGPVWEANHVWLIFVLVVCWTAYPTAFGSITSTLYVPLFIAGIGIIMRGTAYALRSGTTSPREQRAVETVTGISSILTPFALGAVIGGIASGRVPVGNAAGDHVTSWLNPTSAMIGAIAVASSAYLAAVYLAADAVRLDRPEVARAFRVRALAAGLVAGAVAIGALPVVRDDAPEIWDGLTSGAGLAAVFVSAAAGVATLALVWRSRFEPARGTAAVAVSAIIAGWALAQRPDILPGLTIDEAAAGRSTLVTMIVSLALGALLLIPSLVLLFSLLLRGRFDAEEREPEPSMLTRLVTSSRALPVAAVCLVVGGSVMFFLDSTWTAVIGAGLLLVFIGAGLVAVAGSMLEAGLDDEP